MPSYLIRVSSLAAFLIAGVMVPGWGQVSSGPGLVSPRAMPAQPMQPMVPGGAYGTNPYGGERMAAVDPDKKLSAGDMVTIQILEDREPGLQKVITAAGELDIAPYGRVKVSGKTSKEAEGDIKRFLEKDYYYTASVTLSIDAVSRFAVRSGSVQVSGEVRVPGNVEIITGETLTLTGAIFKAGGPGGFANRGKVQLFRQKDGTVQQIEVDFDKLTKSGDARKDPILQDGDRIFVPKKILNF